MKPHRNINLLFLIVHAINCTSLLAEPVKNPPLVCTTSQQCSSCPTVDGPSLGCVLISLDLGRTLPFSGNEPIDLRLYSSEASPSLATPSRLSVVLGYSIKSLEGMIDGKEIPSIVRVVQPEGAELVFHFSENNPIGVPEPNLLGKSMARVMMVDAQGWATSDSPAYYDLYPGDGSVWRFSASGQSNEKGRLVSYTNSRGRCMTPEDFGIEILRDQIGNIRQVKTPTRLADIFVHSDSNYSVSVYSIISEPKLNETTGLYEIPSREPIRFLDIALGESERELLVGFRKGMGDVRQYRYHAVNGDWTLVHPDGLSESQEVYYNEDESAARRIHLIRDGEGNILRKEVYDYADVGWGYLMTNKTEGVVDTESRRTFWNYYTAGSATDLLSDIVEPSGQSVHIEYDDIRRVVKEEFPVTEEVTIYSYEPVDSSDVARPYDSRPRCIIRRQSGIEVERTYYVFGTNGIDIVERAAQQGADYGSIGAMRTIKKWYDSGVGLQAGLIKSIQKENGKTDSYSYEHDNGQWRIFITHYLTSNPDPLLMKTTRDVQVYNAIGKLIEIRKELFIGNDDWRTIASENYSYDLDGNRTETVDFSGRRLTETWGGSCCGKISQTLPDGTVETFTYDSDGRLSIMTKWCHEPVETHYIYDCLGNIVETFRTNTVSHIGTSHQTTVYNSIGQPIMRRDPNGRTETIEYTANGQIVSAQHPSGGIRVETYEAGELQSVTGTAVIARFYVRGTLENGTRWNATLLGSTDSSNRFEVEYYDMLDRLVQKDSSGSSGITNTVLYIYDVFGRPISETATQTSPRGMEVLSRKLFSYDDQNGTKVICKDLNLNSIIDYAGTDEIVMERHLYAIHDNAIWEEKESYRWPTLWKDEPELFERRRVQLSNLENGQQVFESEDVLGNVVRTDIRFDIPEGQMIQTTRFPWSVLPREIVYKHGNLVTIMSESGLTNSFAYDGLNRRIAEIGSRGEVVSFAYNTANQVVATSNNVGLVTFYDYNDEGQPCSISNSVGKIESRSYDLQGRLVQATEGITAHRYDYDEFGQLRSIQVVDTTNNQMRSINFEYDSATGALISKNFSDGTSWTYEYDANRQLSLRENSRGIRTSYSYEHGRLSSLTHDDGTPNWSFKYDRLGRLTAAMSSTGQTNSLAYAPNGTIITNRISGQYRIVKTPDEYGRTIFLCVSSSSGDEVLHQTSYDSLGRVSTMGMDSAPSRYSFGVGNVIESVNTGPLHVTRQYLNNGYQVTCISNATATGIPLSMFQYEYDSEKKVVSRISTIDEICSTNHFVYSPEGYLSRWIMPDREETYEYDVTGTPILDYENQTPDNSFFADGAALFDLDGNLANLSGWNFVWDANNRLVCTSNSNQRILYSYDFAGRIVEELAEGTETWHKWYLWDEYNIVGELLEKNGTTNACWYYWGIDVSGSQRNAGGIGALSAVQIDNTLFFPCYDHEGHIRSYVSETGDTVARYDYDPFGKTIFKSGELSDVFAFQAWTKPNCRELNLIEFQHRMYAPTIHQWLNKDPLLDIGFVHSMSPVDSAVQNRIILNRTETINGYVFSENDPINQYDVLGLDNPGCDLPDFLNPGTGSHEYNKCFRRCCAQHDLCYYKNNCTASSWLYNAGQIILSASGCRFCSILISSFSKCARCNEEVVGCFALCCLGLGPTEGPQWFCPNGPFRGTFYDSLKAIPAS